MTRPDGIEAITFDFGNTLVPVSRSDLTAVVGLLAAHVADRSGVDRAAFLTTWSDERDRQFREEPPRFREVDLAIRLRRVLARLRGVGPPPANEPWDDAAAAALADPGEVAAGLDVYSRAFVEVIPPDPTVGALLGRLRARGLRLAILSNWPLAATIDRYAEAAGWMPHLAAIVVSERVGVIKPHPGIFSAARSALGRPGPPLPAASVLHVGDDWAADVVGGREAGLRVAWLRSRPADSPLPASERNGLLEPDLVLDRLGDLEGTLAPGE